MGAFSLSRHTLGTGLDRRPRAGTGSTPDDTAAQYRSRHALNRDRERLTICTHARCEKLEGRDMVFAPWMRPQLHAVSMGSAFSVICANGACCCSPECRGLPKGLREIESSESKSKQGEIVRVVARRPGRIRRL